MRYINMYWIKNQYLEDVEQKLIFSYFHFQVKSNLANCQLFQSLWLSIGGVDIFILFLRNTCWQAIHCSPSLTTLVCYVTFFPERKKPNMKQCVWRTRFDEQTLCVCPWYKDYLLCNWQFCYGIALRYYRVVWRYFLMSTYFYISLVCPFSVYFWWG